MCDFSLCIAFWLFTDGVWKIFLLRVTHAYDNKNPMCEVNRYVVNNEVNALCILAMEEKETMREGERKRKNGK